MNYRGLVYRAHHLRWAFAPDSGDGAARHGGRFNAVGTPALYTSLRFETAWLEAQQGFPRKTQPMALCAYDVDCDDVADLRDADTRRGFGISPADLGCAWEAIAGTGALPPSWDVCQKLTTAGIAAMIVPSFAHGATLDDVNLVFWTWATDRPHRVLVIDDYGRVPTRA